jgi:folate-binding protein YgfZ
MPATILGAMAVTDRLAADYRTISEACGWLDRSERGKLALTGSGAKEFLNGQVTNEVEELSPGAGVYAAFLTHKGKMLGDLRVLDLGAELFLDTERASLQELFNLLRRFKVGFDVELHKRTLERGLVSLIGPRAREVAGSSPGGAEHDNAPAEIDGVPVHLVATDVGLDVICDSQRTGAVIAALESRGAAAVDEAAAECLRVERGRPRYGVDVDDSTIPQEAGLNQRAVSFTKGCYVGQETVARLYHRGRPNRHLRGLRLSAPATRGERLRLGERQVGTVGSAVVSPALGPIGLALVRREAEPGDTVAVGERDASAEVVELPFRGAAG